MLASASWRHGCSASLATRTRQRGPDRRPSHSRRRIGAAARCVGRVARGHFRRGLRRVGGQTAACGGVGEPGSISLALILTALTAPVAPACRVNPTVMNTMPGMNRTWNRASGCRRGRARTAACRRPPRSRRPRRSRFSLSRRERGRLDADQPRRHGHVADHHHADDDAQREREPRASPAGDDQRRQPSSRPTTAPEHEDAADGSGPWRTPAGSPAAAGWRSRTRTPR